ncbi:IclR family transcriptional regulator [Gordonia otitidis]|uniref:IclR family transcriptional regulator n=1 Tax=Gordonia otitidis TaxID=249058 RepID=UPI001D144E27|nr:IclR family transcriptional regulator [Gordonia otitidis]UEA60256.1 IclR family transcriptional regulator [Gordonia otitidis]
MTIDIESATPNNVLDRASLVLDAFDGPGRLTLAQIVRRTGLPRSSAHRLLDRLVALKWLRRHEHDYELGIRLMELGSIAVHQDRLHRAAMPYLHELHRATGFVVHLAILDGADVVYLEKIGGALGEAIPTRVGGRQPAHCTAVGKAILACRDSSSAVDTQTPLPRKTRYSIATHAALHAELQKVRALNIAYEREESVPKIGCVAAPIGDVDDAIAAVSVCGRSDRMNFDYQLAAPVRMTALSIWRSLDSGSARVAPTLQRPQRLRPNGLRTQARTAPISPRPSELIS